MTSRPCKPKLVLDVDIPHPRDYSVLTSDRFRELMDEVKETVHEEARKSFEAGEVEGLTRMNVSNHSKVQGLLGSQGIRRGITAIIVFLILWELGARSEELFGFRMPWIGLIPPPSGVFNSWLGLLGDPGYWGSWYMSFKRVLSGFLAAMAVGIPLGLLMAVNKTFYGIVFPSFEVLRPIPPLAWVPASIIFWPTQELSIAFVTFLGAFYTIVINVLGGAKSIDRRFFQAAQSMGASQWDLFPPRNIPCDAAIHRSWISSGHGDHLGSSGCRRNDFGGWRIRWCGRRSRFLYLELLCWWILRADRRRYDQYRHRRLYQQRVVATTRWFSHTMAENSLRTFL